MMIFDKKIRKSLYNKTIDGFEYNPQLVVNEHAKTIKHSIIENLDNANRVDIAVSYVVWSGLSLIFEHLKKFDSNSRIIITTEGLVTDPKSLEKLLELNLSVKVYDPYVLNSKGFHLKSYLFEKDNHTTILVGSNNISARAFGMVHEMAVEIDSNNQGYIVDKYQRTFEELWNDPSSKTLTLDFIDSYRDVYNEKMLMDEKIFNLGLESNDIKPNLMQEKALIELELCRENVDRGLVIAATGTGKTYLSAFDVKNFNANKVLFLVHNRLILSTAIQTYERVFKGSKKIMELHSHNIDQIYNADIIFTTDKTAHSYLYNKVEADYFDYIIYDEAHKVGSGTKYDDLINYFKPQFTLGMTATPERTDNPRHLFEVFKYSVPYEIRLLDALEHELVCPFTYYGLNIEERLLKANEEFDYYELAKFIHSAIEQKGYYGEKLRALLFASNIKEATQISDNLNLLGYKSEVAVSTTSTFEDIEKYIESLKSNDPNTLEIICTVNKFNEGVDIPEVNTIIMLRNTTSSIIYLQQLGRGLRKTVDPHKYVTVFDIIGNSKNNYTIAEVLTGNTTMDKRKLFKYAKTNFSTVSPFINVEIDEKAMENIIRSISNNFTVKTKIRNKFRDELHRYKEIPSLVEMYKNPNFKELELLQLLYKSFYDPFEKYYKEKYNIEEGNLFIKKFTELILQFVFRGYNNRNLKDYADLLEGKEIDNQLLARVLLPKLFSNGIPTAINSDYNKKQYNLPQPFIFENNKLKMNDEIFKLLNQYNALEFYFEHIELIKEIAKEEEYQMKTFDLVDKGEFLFNVGAKDCYMNVVGERIDHDKKVVYCTIKITEKESHYDNYIIDNNKVVYYTQSSNTKEKAEEKIKTFIENGYTFYICAQFPHLGYTNTSYFNLGNVKISNISQVLKTNNNKYNHAIEFELESKLPLELIMYKE